MKNKKFIATMLVLNSLLFGSFLSANCIKSETKVNYEKNSKINHEKNLKVNYEKNLNDESKKSNREYELFYNFSEDFFDEGVESLVLFHFFNSVPNLSQNILKQAVQNGNSDPFFINLDSKDENKKQTIENYFKNFDNSKMKNFDFKVLKKNYVEVINSIIKDYEGNELKNLIKDYYSEKIDKINKIKEKKFLKALKKFKFISFNLKDTENFSEIEPAEEGSASSIKLNFSKSNITPGISQNLFYYLVGEELFKFAKTKINDEALLKELKNEYEFFKETNLRPERPPTYKDNSKTVRIYGSDKFLKELKKIANSSEFREYLESEITEKKLENLRQDIFKKIKESKDNIKKCIKEDAKYSVEDAKKDIRQCIEGSKKLIADLQKKKEEDKDEHDKNLEKIHKESIKEHEEIEKNEQKLEKWAEDSRKTALKQDQRILKSTEEFKSHLKDTSTKSLILSSKLLKYEGGVDFPAKK